MNNNFQNNFNFIANLVQILSYQILLHDFNNTDLMKYLEHQDELLNKIIQQNNELLNILRGDEKNVRGNQRKN